MAGIANVIPGCEVKAPSNPSAFPVPGEFCQTGMTLRDYLATGAMQSILLRKDFLLASEEHIASQSYLMADAMLAQRSITKKGNQ